MGGGGKSWKTARALSYTRVHAEIAGITHIACYMTKNLEAAFHQEMLGVYERAKTECRYNAIRFREMVNDHGGRAAAKLLLASKRHPEGLTRLWEEGRLDISMEVLVLTEPWRMLFTDEELRITQKRLDALGYKPR